MVFLLNFLRKIKVFFSYKLHALLLQCWRQGEVPHKARAAIIVSLYRNRGDKGECSNYRRMSILSMAGKIFARVLLKRLQRLADRIPPETQSEYRAGRSTTDMVFTLQEKCRKQRKPLFITFVDLTKAFGTVSRKSL